MSGFHRVPLVEAGRLARELVATLAPACERVEVAGSVRRRRPDIGDIELVAVPRFATRPGLDLFRTPEHVDLLEEMLVALRARGELVAHPERPAAGERYQRLYLPRPGIQIDVFIVRPPAQWGPIFTIRTGPADFSQRLVERLWAYGLQCVDGRVISSTTGETVACPEERDFFRLAHIAWCEPAERR